MINGQRFVQSRQHHGRKHLSPYWYDAHLYLHPAAMSPLKRDLLKQLDVRLLNHTDSI
jgi:hypothetical protein